MIPLDQAPHMNRKQRRTLHALMKIEHKNRKANTTAKGNLRPLSNHQKKIHMGRELLRRDFIRAYGTVEQKAALARQLKGPEKPSKLKRVTNAIANKAKSLLGLGNINLKPTKIFNQRGRPHHV